MKAVTQLLQDMQHSGGGSGHTAIFVASRYRDIPSFPITAVQFSVYGPDQIYTILKQNVPRETELTANRIKDDAELVNLWSTLR